MAKINIICISPTKIEGVDDDLDDLLECEAGERFKVALEDDGSYLIDMGTAAYWIYQEQFDKHFKIEG